MVDKPKKPELKMFDDGMLGFDMPERSPEERAYRKSISTKCGHVSRRVMRNERLSGRTLAFALDVVGDDEMARKLKAGEQLTDYEKHILVDVLLLHTRLGARL